MDQDGFEAGLRREGFEVERDLRLEAGRRTAAHAHPFDVRALVLQGEVTLNQGGAETTYRPGERFDVPAGEDHWEAIGPEGVTYLIGRRPRA